MAQLELPPYLRLRHSRRDTQGFHYELQIVRWHPAWWQLCWSCATAEGLEWWGPGTWAAVLWMIIHGPTDN